MGQGPGPGPETVTLTGLSGTVLFTVETLSTTGTATGHGLLTLPAGSDEAAVDVLVSVARCDPHALIESKTSFTFVVHAAVGDREPALVAVTVAPQVGQTCRSC